MNPLRIAHVDTERTWRGGEQQVVSLIEGLKEWGYTNFLISRAGSALTKRMSGIVPVKEVRPLGEWDFINAHFVNRYLKAEKVDVLHAHTGHGVSLAALSKLGTKIPLVVTRRVDFPLSENPFSRWKYRQVDLIIAISEGVRSVLLQSGIPGNKMTVVPSGVDFRRYQSIHPKTKRDLGLPEDCKLVGQVAALAPHKDQENFLEAIALLSKEIPNVRAVILGEGELRSQLERKRKELGLEGIVQMPGFHENPLDFIPAFDVFCLSSKEEGLGTSLLDAMALKIPVVATRVGGIPELIEDKKTGFLAPSRNPAALAETLKSCLGGKNSHPALLAAAFEKARSFDISNTITKMDRIYRQLST